MEEKIQPAELFEFFEEESDEYAELCYILDYSDGDRFKGEVAEKYFYDCIKRLKTDEIDEQIARLKALIETEKNNGARLKMAQTLQQLIQTKRKIKSGEKI